MVVGGTLDFRVTPNPNFMLDVNLDEEFDNLDNNAHSDERVWT